MHEVKDGYSEAEAKSMIGKRVTHISQNRAGHKALGRSGDVIAHEAVQLKPGVQEHCVWVQWDGSEKAVCFGKSNEGRDFRVDGKKAENEQSRNNGKAICPSGMPPSKQQIAAWKELLSKRKTSMEYTPLGMIGGSCNPQRDRKITAAISATEAVLAEKKNMARNAFQARSQTQSVRRGFNQSSGMSM